jgi:hypothetical protein
MTSDAEITAHGIRIEVELYNDKTGHHIPTGSPLRHMILLVEAHDENGNILKQIDGPKTPEWCGSGKEEHRNYGGCPGKAYAKVLQEDWTQIYPSGAYWNPVTIRSDNRIPAFGRDKSSYLFQKPEDYKGPISIEVKLLFRRAFIKLQQQKGWEDPDILMEKNEHRLSLK